MEVYMYIALFIIVLVLFLYRNRIPEQTSRIIFLVSTTIVIGLRYGIGADYFSYQNIYESINMSGFLNALQSSSELEPLFVILNYVSRLLHIPFHVFMIFLNMVMLYFSYKFIDEHVENKTLGFVLYISLYFMYWNLSAVRQGIIVAIMMYYFFNGQTSFKRKIVITILCSLIHIVALIVPIIYLVSNLNWSTKKLAALILVSPLFKLLYHPTFLEMFTDVPFLSKFVKYLSYDSISYFSIPSLLRLFLIVIIVSGYNQLRERHFDKTVLINFTALNLIMYFYVPGSMVMGTRLTIFGYYGMIVIIPLVFEIVSAQLSRKKFQVFQLVIVSFSCTMFANEMYKQFDRSSYTNSLLAFNFETIFNGEYSDFDNQHAIRLNQAEINSIIITGTSKYNEINNSQIDFVEFNSGDEYISVYFPNHDGYGFINQGGFAIQSPILEDRVSIEGDYYILDTYVNRFVDRLYFSIANSIEVPFELLNETAFNQSVLNRKVTGFGMSTVAIPELLYTQLDALSGISKTPVIEVTEFIEDFNQDIKYLKISTTSYSSFVIVDENNNRIIDRVYESVIPFGNKSYAVGISSIYREYFNRDGEIIWVEENR